MNKAEYIVVIIGLLFVATFIPGVLNELLKRMDKHQKRNNGSNNH